jgi:hypothetical protein
MNGLFWTGRCDFDECEGSLLTVQAYAGKALIRVTFEKKWMPRMPVTYR